MIWKTSGERTNSGEGGNFVFCLFDSCVVVVVDDDDVSSCFALNCYQFLNRFMSPFCVLCRTVSQFYLGVFVVGFVCWFCCCCFLLVTPRLGFSLLVLPTGILR